ncbi:cytochrome b/b6 domain-containing protein [Vibrio sp. Makdt]|uniref:cytochrome b n=1 Tax=Vibrio sp. Makdt TaxID=2998828 RepID=UPI0022CD32B2|nr:cytochrome b/b6 domain-containing protein [Vibrio sp. Makdt]MDA0153453.1 cytochrome b/b6 domain-containing protein [Vibrio sp. Makdt]
MNNPRYDLVSRVLHWVMASVIIYATIAGYVMHYVTSHPELFSFLSVLNMSLATVATPLLMVRYIWSHFRSSPSMPTSIPEGQKCVAKLAHSLMYLAMFMVFSTGYLMLEQPYSLFWLTTVENLITNSAINSFFFYLHRASCIALACLIVLHISAALKHHFVSKNYVLKMMI